MVVLRCVYCEAALDGGDAVSIHFATICRRPVALGRVREATQV